MKLRHWITWAVVFSIPTTIMIVGWGELPLWPFVMMYIVDAWGLWVAITNPITPEIKTECIRMHGSTWRCPDPGMHYRNRRVR